MILAGTDSNAKVFGALKDDLIIRAIGIQKSFPIIASGSAWRILLGMHETEEWFPALNSVTLSVPKGRILGVLGRNGAGKSTLLRVLAGVYEPSAGKVEICGNVASLFELGGLGTRFITGREYADRLFRFQGIRGKRLAALVNEVCEFAELGSFFERRIYTYSSGMAARLYFSVATAIRKDVYLIDELLSVGDEHFQSKCWRRIRDLLSDGASGVLVTHDWSAVIKLCEHSLVLDRGSVAFSGVSDKVVADYLRLPAPSTDVARFGSLPEVFTGLAGQDWTLTLPIEVMKPGQVEFAFSIELLRLGLGWEIMLLSKFHEVVSAEGVSSIAVRIPQLPLAEGRYSLNLFLRQRQPDGTLLACDTRTWTSGNGCVLVVNGANNGSAVTRIPIQWRNLGDDRAVH